MTIRPIALRMENFRSFKKSQTFTFPTEPGLYFMLGKNEVEPRMAGNGSGKSTIWDALTWLLHGKTPSGLKAGDVCNWDVTKGVEVSLEFRRDADADGKHLPEFVKRTWGPISWRWDNLFGKSVDLAKDPQNEVLAELRLAFDPWLCSVLMAQGEDMFLDMKKDAQAALFGSVMNLDKWMDRADRASDAAKKQDRVSRDLEGRLADTRGRLEVLQRDDAAGDRKRWEDKRQERLDRLTEDHTNLSNRRKGLKGALEAAIEREETARRGVATSKPDEALEDALVECERELRRLEDALLKIKVQLDAVLDHRKALNKQDAACPHCNRPFDTKHWQQEHERCERAIRSLNAEHDQVLNKITIARNRRDVVDKQLRTQEEKLVKARGVLNDAAHEMNRARSDLAQLDKQLDGVEDMYADIERERNPFDAAIERAAQEAEELRDRVWELQRSLDDSNSQYSIKSYWVRGFKEIRLREIASALSELEVEVNSCVTALGLVDWEMEFSVDRETKGGTVQRGFSVFVRTPSAPDRAVPWEAWCGGEKQRLRVAANMGLGNLVRGRTGCDFPLEVWDEPTNGLSPEGKVDLFTALAARAKTESRIIFLVDHQAHDFGGFSGTCTVIKTPSGSRIRTSWGSAV